MGSRKFRDRMGWQDVEETKFREATAPRKSTLNGYSLIFNKPTSEERSAKGLANIVPDPDATVEGVLLHLK
jgi:hypothetical protein